MVYYVPKTGTSDSRKDWFAVGEYKKLPNEAGGDDTTLPENVADEIRKLLADYNALLSKTFEDIVALDHEKGFLMDTCLTAQDRFKAHLDYFRIAYR